MAKYEGLPDKNIITSLWNKIKNWIEQQGYKTTDTNTTYTLEQSSSDGHIISLKSSEGENQTITIPSGASMNDIVNLIYPVGAIYLSTSEVSPGTLFGGTWERLKDRMLIGAGDAYKAAATGGSSKISYTPSGTVSKTLLTAAQSGHEALSGTFTSGNQSKDHQHWIPEQTTTGENINHTHNMTGISTSALGQPSLGLTVSPAYAGLVQVSGSNKTGIENEGHVHNVKGHYTNGMTTNHTHNVAVSFTAADAKASHGHGFEGTPTTLDTISPYLAVYMWKRIA